MLAVHGAGTEVELPGKVAGEKEIAGWVERNVERSRPARCSEGLAEPILTAGVELKQE